MTSELATSGVKQGFRFHPKTHPIARGFLIATAILAVLATAAYFAAVTWGISHRTLTLYDSARQRPVAVDIAMRRALGRAFRITPDLAHRYPGLEARANRYLPIVKGTLSFFIGALTLLFLLEAWGLDSFAWFGQGQLGSRLVGSLASITFTMLAALAAWEAANAAIARHLARLSRDGIQAHVASADLAVVPLLDAVGLEDHPRGAVLIGGGNVRVEHVGRLGDVIVHADQNQIVLIHAELLGRLLTTSR